jgi:hypothetical protein
MRSSNSSYSTVLATSAFVVVVLSLLQMIFAEVIMDDVTNSINDETATTTATKNVIKILYCVS